MPYEATVPVHRRLLWPAVIDPERLLSALPNAVIDASGNQGVAGRLRVRMRDQTVTFRGIARIIEVIPKSLRVTMEVEATFGRAAGAVEGVIEITLRAAGSGTRAVVSGSLRPADGSAPLPPGDAVDAALGRIVRRWFAALAESSPAAPRAELPEAPPATVEPPRAAERTPLAVVRDVPSADSGAVAATAVADTADTADAEDVAESEAEKPDDGDPADTGSESADAGRANPEDDRARVSDSPSAEPAHAESLPGEDSEPGSGFEAGESRRAEPAAARAAGPHVQLRLVSSRESVVPDEEAPDSHDTAAGAPWGPAPRRGEEPEPPTPTAEFEPVSDAGVDAGEDIWSRLRDRGMPRWIPVAVSAVLAGFGSTVLFVMALRRRHHRHED